MPDYRRRAAVRSALRRVRPGDAQFAGDEFADELVLFVSDFLVSDFLDVEESEDDDEEDESDAFEEEESEPEDPLSFDPPSFEPLSLDPWSLDPWSFDEVADFLPRLSVLKNPDPLNVTPTGVKTFLTASNSPDSGWATSVRVSS